MTFATIYNPGDMRRHVVDAVTGDNIPGVIWADDELGLFEQWNLVEGAIRCDASGLISVVRSRAIRIVEPEDITQ